MVLESNPSACTTMLHDAISQYGNNEMLTYLLDNRIGIEHLHTPNGFGQTPLTRAANMGLQSCVELLLKHGAVVDSIGTAAVAALESPTLTMGDHDNPCNNNVKHKLQTTQNPIHGACQSQQSPFPVWLSFQQVGEPQSYPDIIELLIETFIAGQLCCVDESSESQCVSISK